MMTEFDFRLSDLPSGLSTGDSLQVLNQPDRRSPYTKIPICSLTPKAAQLRKCYNTVCRVREEGNAL